MTTALAEHVDFSEVVVNYFARTGRLPPEVMENPDLAQELIDAIPDSNRGLIDALRLLRMEGA